MLRGFGVDLVIDQVARGLAERGHEVSVYASVTDQADTGGYTLKMIPTPAYSFFPRYELSAQRHLKFLNSEGNDVFLIETFPFFSYLPRLKGHRVAVDHGVSSTEGFPLKIRANFSYVRFTHKRIYLRYAERIIMVSDYLKKSLPAGLQKKTSVIYNGADHYHDPGAAAAGKALRDELGVGEGDVLLLYVGRLNAADQPYKGTAELVALYRRLRASHPEIRLLMVGFGGPKEKAWLEGEGVLVIENAPAELMPAVFSACDVYTTASRWEGFDLPLVEAQSFGKPVVALRIGAHPEVVAEGWSGYLTDTVEDMGGAIVRLATDGAARERMGMEARANADRFRWGRAVEQYERLLQELVS